jgi:hypothetical protein
MVDGAASRLLPCLRYTILSQLFRLVTKSRFTSRDVLSERSSF